MLTEKLLKELTPGGIFATGTRHDPRLYRGGMIQWVAVRGEGMHDWAIYYHRYCPDREDSVEWVKRFGDKCSTEAVIKELVPCDDEAFALYRF